MGYSFNPFTNNLDKVGGATGNFLKLDQTTPQTVENGIPNFSEGININSTQDEAGKVWLDVNMGDDDGTMRYRIAGQRELRQIWYNDDAVGYTGDKEVVETNLDTFLKQFEIGTTTADYDLIFRVGGKNILKGDGVDEDWTFYYDSMEGETQKLKVCGYKTGDSLRTMSQGFSSVVGGTYKFTGASVYYFDQGVNVEGTQSETAFTVYDNAAGTYPIRVNGDAAYVLFDDANAGYKVGIGTDTPTEKLDVNGNSVISGTLVVDKSGDTGLMKHDTTTGAISYITDNSANWNTAYSWGNHAAQGYLTSPDHASSFRVFKKDSQTIASDSWETLQYNAANWDITSSFDISKTYHWIVRQEEEGLYDIKARVKFITPPKMEDYGKGCLGIRFMLNGNVWSYGGFKVPGDHITMPFRDEIMEVMHTDKILVKKYDEVWVEVFQSNDTRSDWDIIPGSEETYFSQHQFRNKLK